MTSNSDPYQSLSSQTIPQLENLLEKKVLSLEATAIKWAGARGDLNRLKSKKERIFYLSCEQITESSQAAKERIANTTIEVQNAIKEYDDAYAIECDLKARYDVAILKVDVLRTILSTKREMVKREIL